MQPDSSFFAIAAGLIPVLLLGGAITDRVRPLKVANAGIQWTLLATALFFLPAFAEVTAISAALSSHPSQTQVWTVVIAVAFGTWALAVAVTWPLQELVWRTGKGARVAMVVGVGTLTLMSALALESAVDLQFTERNTSALVENGPLSEYSVRLLDAREQLVEARLANGALGDREASLLKLLIARERVSHLRGMRELDRLVRFGPP